MLQEENWARATGNLGRKFVKVKMHRSINMYADTETDRETKRQTDTLITTLLKTVHSDVQRNDAALDPLISFKYDFKITSFLVIKFTITRTYPTWHLSTYSSSSARCNITFLSKSTVKLRPTIGFCVQYGSLMHYKVMRVLPGGKKIIYPAKNLQLLSKALMVHPAKRGITSENKEYRNSFTKVTTESCYSSSHFSTLSIPSTFFSLFPYIPLPFSFPRKGRAWVYAGWVHLQRLGNTSVSSF